MWRVLGTCWAHRCVLPVEALGGKSICVSSHAYAWPSRMGNYVKVSLGTIWLYTPRDLFLWRNVNRKKKIALSNKWCSSEPHTGTKRGGVSLKVRSARPCF